MTNEKQGYIERIADGYTYDTTEMNFFSPKWEARTDSVSFLKNLIEMYPEKFDGCRIATD
jgi:hypothetical protein